MRSYPVHGSKSKVFSAPLRRASTFSLKERTRPMVNTGYCCQRPSEPPEPRTPTQSCWWSLCAPQERVQDLWRRTGRWRTAFRCHWRAGSAAPPSAPSAGIPLPGSGMGFLRWGTNIEDIYYKELLTSANAASAGWTSEIWSSIWGFQSY